MTSLPIYPEHTVIRIFTPDRSAHYTGIVCQEGTVIEVKRPNTDGQPPSKYPSYAAWIAERRTDPEMHIAIDYKKATGAPITDLHGFNYPLDCPWSNRTGWLRWVFNLINEATPHHMSNPTVRDAYNEIVRVAEEAGSNLWFSLTFRGNPYFAASELIYDPSTNTRLAGLHAGLNIRDDPIKTAKLTYELLSAYKAMIDIVGADIRAFAAKKWMARAKELALAGMRKDAVYLERRVVTLEAELKYAKAALERQCAKIAVQEASD